MTLGNKIFAYRVTIIIILLALLAYVLPFFLNISISNFGSLLSDNDGLYEACVRSLSFAFFSSILNITLSFYLATQLRKIKPFSIKGLLLSILIIPTLIGNVSTSFIFKLILSDFVQLQQDSFQKLIVGGVIQFWQYGTLFTYILWLVLSRINSEKFNYCKVSYFTNYEVFIDIIVPSCKNTITLLFIINFLFSVYDESKMQLIFRSSRGTNTEFINQWLTRTYQSDSLINPVVAGTETFSTAFVFVFILFVILAITVSLLLSIFNIVARQRSSITVISGNRLPIISFYLLMSFVAFPIVFILIHVFFNFSLSFEHLLYPLYLSLLTALISIIFAIVIGASIRVGWFSVMDNLNKKSQFVFYLILLLQLIPGIVISLLGYQWAAFLDIGVNYIVLLWVIGHVLMILPVISCLLITTHFSVSNDEINYLFSHKTSFLDFIKVSFLGRFKGDYLLTFLICVTMIWNDPILNSILSDYVPSFISEMKMSITGRATDYSKGISYFAISLIVALGAYSVWVRNNYKKSLLHDNY